MLLKYETILCHKRIIYTFSFNEKRPFIWLKPIFPRRLRKEYHNVHLCIEATSLSIYKSSFLKFWYMMKILFCFWCSKLSIKKCFIFRIQNLTRIHYLNFMSATSFKNVICKSMKTYYKCLVIRLKRRLKPWFSKKKV